jgi:hypothetical protein
MLPITNLKLHDQQIVDNSVELVFVFDKHISSNIGGYWLYKSLDTEATFTRADFKVDARLEKENTESTVNEGSKTYFTYSINEEDYGREIYFYISAISTSWEESTENEIIRIYTAPNSPQNFTTYFDNYTVTASWERPEIDLSLYPNGGKNSKISSYSIYRNKVYPLENFTIDEDNLFLILHPALNYGKYFVAFDTVKKIIKKGYVTSIGEVDLSDDSFSTNINDLSYDYIPNIDSIKLFILNEESNEFIGFTSDKLFYDTKFEKNSYYIYSVIANGYGDYSSSSSSYFLSTEKLNNVTPYLRNPINAENTLIGNKYWQIFKKVLIDKNYYNKDVFAIPYINNELYNFKGYLGQANCNVDIFIDNEINKTVKSDKYVNITISLT